MRSRFRTGGSCDPKLMLVLVVGLCTVPASAGGPGLATTIDDYFQPGTQPNTLTDPILDTPGNCQFCHGGYDAVVEPYRPWAASMMGQAARDPMFYACLTISNQDAADAGEFCIRCHVPNAYLEGRSVPTDGSGFVAQDLEGINCHFCHRLVNPEFPVPGDGPDSDSDILADLDVLGLLPPQGANSRFVLDPIDTRRGPFEDLETNNPHVPAADTLYSPFHSKAEFCWTCHDVSNPLFMRQPDGTYVLEEATLGVEHATHDQFDMFPLHRTYSEWKNSYYFTTGGVQHNGRFGGNHPTGVMGACQDCHMPDQQGDGCIIFSFPSRPDVPQHSFIGSNTWGLKAVRAVDYDGDLMPDYPDSQTGLSNDSVNAMIARNVDMLEKASDVVLTQVDGVLRVRIFNQGGHKLPTGFPDGRRMWINVKFMNLREEIDTEHGEFNFGTGEIVNPQDTKVYEIKLGVDAAQSALTGLPVGETFHFVLANTIEKDNRIPPTGFSNTQAELNQTVPVGAVYGDGQHWDDTDFQIPPCAVEAVVTVYYQLVSREYITFLRDSNVTDNRGQVAFDLWDDPAIGNRSAPVVMDMETLSLATTLGDIDGDGFVGIAEFLFLLGNWGPCPPEGECPSDLDCDGDVGINDFLVLLGLWK